MAAKRAIDADIRYPFTCSPVFDMVMRDEGLCRRFLERVLGTEVGEITYHAVEHEVAPALTARSVRLDAYLESEGAVYDIELQACQEAALGERLRYYQAALDTDVLGPGEPYSRLPGSYIVFVCDYDPYGRGLPVYDLVRSCPQDPTVEVGDRSPWRVLNARAWADEPDEGLRSLLKYVAGGNASDELTEELDAAVDRINSDPRKREDVNGFMTLEHSMAARADVAHKKGVVEGEARMAELFDQLASVDRIPDYAKATKDAAYRDALMREFGIA